MKPAGAALALLVRLYQLVIRPIFPPACRFEPSCSSYAIEALRTHGALRGLGLATWRILRCNPWAASGYDPVPPCGQRHPVHRNGTSALREATSETLKAS